MANKMTRQEQINEAWCNYRGKCSTEILHALAFALRWCDQHPHWISVEDALPPNKGGFSDEVLGINMADNTMWGAETHQPRTLGGFSPSPADDAAVEQGQYTERQIAERIFGWWISGKPYSEWYADTIQQLKIDFNNN